MAGLATDKIDKLRQDLPTLFENYGEESWPINRFDEYVIVPIDNVETALPEDEPDWRLGAGQLGPPGLPEHFDCTSEFLEELILSEMNSEDSVVNAVATSNLAALDPLGASHRPTFPGGPIVKRRSADYFPPPDAYAFYLPFHLFAPEYWGVYLTVEGVMEMASGLRELSSDKLSVSDAIFGSRLFLYYHEAFHHAVECFATRLEMTERMPRYKEGFQEAFDEQYLTEDCLEEGLANAHAYRETQKKTRNPILMKALATMIVESDPGYNRGIEFLNRFANHRNDMSEVYFGVCFPRRKTLLSRVWQTMGHLYHGISNIRGRTNYIIRRDSPLLERQRFRPFLTQRKLLEKLGEYGEVRLNRHGGRHDHYLLNGNLFTVPRHSRDLNGRTIQSILKQAGINASLAEFRESRDSRSR